MEFLILLYGNLSGLKPSRLKSLEKIYSRRIPANQIVTPELARYLTQLSFEINRQIGVLVNRGGSIKHVIVGDDREIMIPDLSHYPVGRGGLKGLRCIHTHLDHSPLSNDDITDLSLLRLDMMMVICVARDGLPGEVYYSYILPPNPEKKSVESVSLPDIHHLDLDARLFLRSLEEEIFRKVADLTEVSGTGERAILVSVSSGNRHGIEDSLTELEELARTAGVHVVAREVQRTSRPNPKYLVGAGKLKEVVIMALEKGADLLIFDQNLTAAQIRSISSLTEIRVIDRTQVILDIFAKRAHTLDGKCRWNWLN